MAFHYSPNILTDGLILCYDPANTNSFVSGSTSLFDLTSNKYDAQLTNGPVYSTDSKGSILLDLTDDKIDFPRLSDSTDGTISIWFKNDNEITSATTATELFKFSSGVTSQSQFKATLGNVFFATGRTELLTIQLYSSTPSTIAGSYEADLLPITGNTLPVKWYNLTISRDSLGTRVYFDNVLLGVPSPPSSDITIITTTTNQFGRSAWNLNEIGFMLGGLVSHFSIYNRSLTTEEVNGNYQALKNRFGL
jgi:hypothetical protein